MYQNRRCAAPVALTRLLRFICLTLPASAFVVGVPATVLAGDASIRPDLNKTFSPDVVAVGEASTLTLEIVNDNGGLAPAINLNLIDNLPVGLVIATPANSSTTCGGVLTADAGGTSITQVGGSVAIDGSCTVEVDVVGTVHGTFDNTATVDSNYGLSPPGMDTLFVHAPPGFSKEFAPAAVPVGGVSTLTFTIDNTTSTLLDATSLDFTDNLPAGLEVANPANTNVSGCSSGSLTADPGSGAISFTNGSLTDGFVCTIAVDVVATSEGTKNNVTGDLTSNFGNSGTASATLEVTEPADDVRPTVKILDAPRCFAGLDPFKVKFRFSEDVEGFGLADIVVDNGSASDFHMWAPHLYSAMITPSGYSKLTIDVPAHAAQDLAGNGNHAAKQVRVCNKIPHITQRAIANFLYTRGLLILGATPKIIPFLDPTSFGSPGDVAINGYMGDSGTQMDVHFATSMNRIQRAFDQVDRSPAATPGATSAAGPMAYAGGQAGDAPAADAAHRLAFDGGAAGEAEATADTVSDVLGTYGSSPPGWDVWVELHGSHSDNGPSETDLWIAYLGGHVFLAPNLLVGVMAQLDWADETNDALGSDADGFGWMVGPYLAAQLPGHPLYFEARAAWGESDNTVSPIGTYKDDFDTTRWLGSAKLEGRFTHGALTVAPAARVSYFNERQHSYTDSLMNPIPSQTIALGELRFGPTLSYDANSGGDVRVVPSLGLEGVWNFGIEEGATSSAVLDGTEELRARLNGELRIISTGGMSLTAKGFYDGIGADGYDAYGGDLRVSVPLP